VGLAISAITLAFVAASCGGEDLPAPPSTTSKPPPPDQIVSVAEVRRLDNPKARTVLGFLRYLQLGSWPLVLDLYDPRAIDIVGAGTLISTLSTQRPLYRTLDFEVTSVEESGRRSLVTAKGTPTKGRPTMVSFVLVGPSKSPLVLYDTIVADNLAYQVQAETQARIDPHASKASRAALLAGATALRKYQTLFLEVGRATEKP
jgi:hypothetical protein